MVDEEVQSAFQKFWEKYPSVKGRKREKPKCATKFAEIVAAGRIDDLRRAYQADLTRWNDPHEREYSPAPLVYLRSHWDREIDEADETVSLFEKFARAQLEKAIRQFGTLSAPERRAMHERSAAEWKNLSAAERISSPS